MFLEWGRENRQVSLTTWQKNLIMRLYLFIHKSFLTRPLLQISFTVCCYILEWPICKRIKLFSQQWHGIVLVGLEKWNDFYPLVWIEEMLFLLFLFSFPLFMLDCLWNCENMLILQSLNSFLLSFYVSMYVQSFKLGHLKRIFFFLSDLASI